MGIKLRRLRPHNVLKKNKGKIIILIIYVDDMIIIGDERAKIEIFEIKLSKEFEMKNLGGGG
jgi:hypothetical protein